MTYIRNTWLLNRGVLVVVACAWLVGGGAWARETKSDNRLQERFFREGPAKWEEYSRRAQRLQGRINYKLKGSNGDITAVNTYAVKMNESCKLIATSLTTTKAGKLTLEGYQVTAANSDYAFALRRKKPDLPWVVTKLINLETASFPQDFQDEFEGFESPATALVKLEGEFLVDVIGHEYFRVLGCRSVTQAGEDLVEITFDYAHDKPNTRAVQGGIMVLDPRRFWCVRSFDVRMEIKSGNEIARGTVKYDVLEVGLTDGDLPVPKQTLMVGKFVWDKGKNEQELHYEYELNAPRILPPDEDFTLSAFGLPEPTGRPKHSLPLFLWTGIAGLACLLAAAALWRVKRSTATTISSL